ncbi:MAG TPA: hypothetical protein VHS96_09995, partial [Bacteroidia bacterium]|nr:hypothetical protein [Bacteroidia bacterium]
HEIMYEAINAMWHTCKEESLFQLEEILLRILNDGKPDVYTNLEEWRLDHPSQVHLEINLPLHHSPSVARDALWDIFMAEQYASEEKD